MAGFEHRALRVPKPPHSGGPFPDEELPELLLRPQRAARVVGPGRRERAYLARIQALAEAAHTGGLRARELKLELGHAQRALETSQRVERGCQRRLDRMEDRLDRRERELTEAHRAHKRLSLALGALQREAELLRQRLAAAGLSGPAPAGLLDRPPARGLWGLRGRRARPGRT